MFGGLGFGRGGYEGIYVCMHFVCVCVCDFDVDVDVEVHVCL